MEIPALIGSLKRIISSSASFQSSKTFWEGVVSAAVEQSRHEANVVDQRGMKFNPEANPRYTSLVGGCLIIQIKSFSAGKNYSTKFNWANHLYLQTNLLQDLEELGGLGWLERGDRTRHPLAAFGPLFRLSGRSGISPLLPANAPHGDFGRLLWLGRGRVVPQFRVVHHAPVHRACDNDDNLFFPGKR